MTQFPDPIPLSEKIYQARSERSSHLVSAARWGVVIRFIIIVIELLGVVFLGSASLLLDAISSSLDIVSSLVLLFFIKLAARPPDQDHPFGHGRYEPLAGLQLGVLMILIGAGMAFQQLFELVEYTSNGTIDPRVWIIPFIATLLLEACYQIISYVAKTQHCPALKADAVHYRMDALTSLFATAALLLAAKFPEWSVRIDHLGAILIALLMIIVGFFASRSNIHQLMDKVPDSDFFEKVRKASLLVEGVLETEKIRIQLYGPDAHVDVDIEVSPDLSVDEAHRISQKVRRSIQSEWPAVRDVSVHIEPFYPGDH